MSGKARDCSYSQQNRVMLQPCLIFPYASGTGDAMRGSASGLIWVGRFAARQDKELAAQMLMDAATLGHIGAMVELGLCAWFGEGNGHIDLVVGDCGV